jgi:hypothetical protein
MYSASYFLSREVRDQLARCGEKWCHEECFDRWLDLHDSMREAIGGHIHYDMQSKAWRVPVLCSRKCDTGADVPGGGAA